MFSGKYCVVLLLLSSLDQTVTVVARSKTPNLSVGVSHVEDYICSISTDLRLYLLFQD